MNIKDLSSRLGLDEEDFRVLLDLLISTAARDLEKLSDAVENNEMESVGTLAHSLKGSAGNLGFLDFSAVAETVENKAGQVDINSMEDDVRKLYSEFGQIKLLLKGS